MIFLLGSIVLSSWLTLSFKIIERLKIPMLQAIVVNYGVCVITGSVFNGASPFHSQLVRQPWLGWALLMGLTFIFLFNIIGFTTQKLGVSVASVANKLSLVIPFIFSIYLYHEKATVLKVTGVIVALVAVVLTCWPSGNREPSGKKFVPVLLFLPLVLFIGSGLLDTMIKFVERTHLNDGNKNDFLITAFAVAGMIGLLILVTLLALKKEKFDRRSIGAGIMIGVPNYFSIWFLVQVLKQFADDSSKIIPLNNMGIVLFSTVAAWIFFREKLSALNWLGIFFSLGAIALIAYG
ncbi:MAG: EamA/RhaT family transporter [Terrimonas sp.]|nr:EamA/RhaT family transporter [Terrimonas sp.]